MVAIYLLNLLLNETNNRCFKSNYSNLNIYVLLTGTELNGLKNYTWAGRSLNTGSAENQSEAPCEMI